MKYKQLFKLRFIAQIDFSRVHAFVLELEEKYFWRKEGSYLVVEINALIHLSMRICSLSMLLCEQGSSTSSESSPSREASPLEGAIEDMQSRIKRLERWQAINTVLPQTLL